MSRIIKFATEMVERIPVVGSTFSIYLKVEKNVSSRVLSVSLPPEFSWSEDVYSNLKKNFF